ncbi:tol-pal system YbgF family protein [Schlesneria sp. T3-172]|uniref:tetratricopeptide repeat protein n=1 Tax=Schlesneria sphaerica TaxID=3373610 RepID=UPI0037CC16B8
MRYGRLRLIALFFFLVLHTSLGQADENLVRYFEQLRQRSLHAIAIAEAMSRLSDPSILPTEQNELTIQLSRTLAEQAGNLPDDQRDASWIRARTLIEERLDQAPLNPRAMLLLRTQLASVWIAESTWMRAEREYHPYDEALLERAHSTAIAGIEILRPIEQMLVDPPVDMTGKKADTSGPTNHQMRLLLHQVRWELGVGYRNLAELASPDSADRAAHVASAEQYMKQLVGVADEPLQTRARILLATCARLAGRLDRATELIGLVIGTAEKTEAGPSDEMLAEQTRILLDQQRPIDAADLLVKVRSKRRRLTGELWFLRTRSLIALRDVTIEKKQEALSDELAEQIAAAIERCEQQVGGYWARRCHVLWADSKSAHQYGPELDALMQQARTDFTSGRFEEAVSKYSAAEKVAQSHGQTDLAMELGSTGASILLNGKKFDAAATEYFRLVQDYPSSPRSANFHLLGTYSLGRAYDAHRTLARRGSYTEALDRHLTDYPLDETANEVRFLKGQLEEQRLQSTAALPLYLQVAADHPRALEAMAGAARSYEAILRRMRERQLPSTEITKAAIETLSKYLEAGAPPAEEWSTTHADIALRFVSILLMEADASRTENSTPGSSPSHDAAHTSAKARRYEQARAWLNRVEQFTARNASRTDGHEAIATLKSRSVPFEILLLARDGNFFEAGKTLESSSLSPAEQLEIVAQLSSVTVAAPVDERPPLARLVIRAGQKLLTQADKFSEAQKEQLQQNLVNAYLITGQVSEALELARSLSEATSRHPEKQRQLAALLSESPATDGQKLAQQLWRRVETLNKPGTTEWMTARYEVLQCYVRLNQLDEGRKLLEITKVLYPELGGKDLKPQFDALEKSLSKGK